MVTIIFTGLDVETLINKIRNNTVLSNLINFIRTNRIFVKAISLCLVGVMAIVVTIVAVGLTVGFNVKYSGKVIATVHDSTVFEDAKSIAAQNVSSEDADLAIGNPKYTLTITVADKLDTAAKVANAIIENTDIFVYGTAIKVDGEIIACVENQGLAEKLEARRTAYYVEGAENTACFADKVQIESGYYLKEEVVSSDEADSVINSLRVKTTSRITTETEIGYGTRRIKTTAKPVGYSNVDTKGQKGLKRCVEEVERINGSVISCEEISNEVVKEAVTEVITEGMASSRRVVNSSARASSAGFICPMNSGTYTISAYYGDGRNHRGLDFAAKTGTPIFAVAGGTVTYAGYDSDFGYNIVVDHHNGIKTRYAHANALCVSKGATVSQGEMIATVGNTGRSTGSHLHFEVIVNGTRVNPAPYVGK